MRCACDRVIQSGDCWTQNEGFVIRPVTNVVRDGLDHKSRVLCTDNLHVGSKTITMHQHEGCFDCILTWVVLLQTLWLDKTVWIHRPKCLVFSLAFGCVWSVTSRCFSCDLSEVDHFSPSCVIQACGVMCPAVCVRSRCFVTRPSGNTDQGCVHVQKSDAHVSNV